ncbi:MAG: hypothetical protein J5562_06800 [Clostridia bacterium]|nr:hypothetical protein [Clostridia bacterium]
MVSKYYSLAGLILRVDSETPIENSDRFEEFYAPQGSADITVTVVNGKLPQKSGEPLYKSLGRETYSENGCIKLYSSYYRPDYWTDYACRETVDGRVTLCIDYEQGLWDSMLFNALNIPGILAQKGVFLLHSSFVIHNGEALIFSGEKGAGKSTQAALWNSRFGDVIVNGDRSLLKFENSVLTAYGTPYCGSSRIALNKNAPVRAIVMLDKGDENIIEKLSGIEAFGKISAQLSYEKNQTGILSDFVSRICGQTDIYNMKCLPDISAVTALEEILWQV